MGPLAALAVAFAAPAASARGPVRAEVATSPQGPTPEELDMAADSQDDSQIVSGAGHLIAGAAVSRVQADGGLGERTAHGGSVGMHEVVYLNFHELWSLRAAQTLHLGISGLKPLASLYMDIAIGRRVPMIGESGLVARLGLRGNILGSSLLREGMLELPQAQIGYHVPGRHSVLEFGVRGALALVSTFEPHDARRRPDPRLAYSLYLGAHHRGLHLDVEATRLDLSPSQQGVSPVDILSGSLCGSRRGWGGCLTARYLTGTVHRDDHPDVRGTSLQLGLLVGIAVDATYRPSEQPSWLRPDRPPPPPPPPVTVYQGPQ